MPPVAIQATSEKPLSRSQPTKSKMKSSQSSWSEFQPSTHRMIRDIWTPFLDTYDSYVSSQELKEHNICIYSLDIKTGEATDSGQQFFRPISTKWIDEILSKNRPWESESGVPDMMYEPDTNNFLMAQEIWAFFETLLNKTHNDEGDALGDRAWWYCRWPRDIERLVKYYSCGFQWHADAVFEKWDRSVPHRILYLVDNAPLKKGILGTSELNAILASIGSRTIGRKYEAFRIAPVALITASGTEMRVTVAYLNVPKRRLVVRQAEILDLAKGLKGPEYVWQKVLSILSWVMADPIGKTTEEHCR